jgi:hypothetical protein
VPEPAEQPPERQRLNLSELARLLIAQGSRHVADRSSVRLTRNARGGTQIEVVVGAGEEGLGGVDEVAAKARAVYDELAELYPLAEAGPPHEMAPRPEGGGERA